ncbi:MAG: hypothetical protein ACOCWG_03785 [bacterium]
MKWLRNIKKAFKLYNKPNKKKPANNELLNEQNSFSRSTKSNRHHEKSNPVKSFMKKTKKEQNV